MRPVSRKAFRCLLFAALIAPSASSGATEDAKTSKGHKWTINDILTAPQITDLTLSPDAEFALFVVRTVNVETNDTEASLRRIDLGSREQRTLLKARSISQVKVVPGRGDFSLLADQGTGQQLYQLDPKSETLEPLIVNENSVLVGYAAAAIPSASFEAPKRVGVISYDWSPDENWLWYSILVPSRQIPAVKTGGDVLRATIGSHSNLAQIEFHLRSKHGEDRLVAIRPATDPIALRRGGLVRWRVTGVLYDIDTGSNTGENGRRTIHAPFHPDQAAPVTTTQDGPSPPLGPWGGQLLTEGYGTARYLVEVEASGRKHEYGNVDFVLNDPRSAGTWASLNGQIVIVGTRGLKYPRYDLAIIDRAGLRMLQGKGSLTQCDFSRDLAIGICVHEGQQIAPELVKIAPKGGRLTPLAEVSKRHSGIAPLRITSHIWTNRLGYYATGFVVWPRDYSSDRRYPAIIVTHGSDADERFANPHLQWNYPVQVLAEQGYFVLLINDPALGQSSELSEAFETWVSGAGTKDINRMQCLLWFNGVYSFEGAVAELITAGLIDPERIGIAGYSRGSQMVNVAMTNSLMFKAASSGDGGYLEPESWQENEENYRSIFGGSPYGKNLTHYERLSPSLRADRVRGAVLQQLAEPRVGALALYRALKDASVPTEISLYPGETALSRETHIFHIPSNRLAAMRENIDWFDFWLRQIQAVDGGNSHRMVSVRARGVISGVD